MRQKNLDAQALVWRLLCAFGAQLTVPRFPSETLTRVPRPRAPLLCATTPRARFANNKANYQFTDVYATPEKNQHIYDSDHKCSDRSGLDIARAYRNRDDASMGYCFHLGQKRRNSNCICGDSYDSQFNFNKCPGQHGNVRRYNAQWKNNRKCSGMHTKCHGYGNHGNLGDTYGCNAPGQRGVQGHKIGRAHV